MILRTDWRKLRDVLLNSILKVVPVSTSTRKACYHEELRAESRPKGGLIERLNGKLDAEFNRDDMLDVARNCDVICWLQLFVMLSFIFFRTIDFRLGIFRLGITRGQRRQCEDRYG